MIQQKSTGKAGGPSAEAEPKDSVVNAEIFDGK
jgi:hypothetical protein